MGMDVGVDDIDMMMIRCHRCMYAPPFLSQDGGGRGGACCPLQGKVVWSVISSPLLLADVPVTCVCPVRDV